jgi:hypothetical protein
MAVPQNEKYHSKAIICIKLRSMTLSNILLAQDVLQNRANLNLINKICQPLPQK